MANVIIRNGSVVTMDDELGILTPADVHLVDGEIVAVGHQLAVGDAEEIDASNAVVAPGFVDTHRHLWETVMRGTLSTCSLGAYFGTVMGRFAPTFTAEDLYAGNLLGAYEALNAGVTTVVDWCNCCNTPEHADAAIAALRETGIRSLFGYGWPGGIEWLLDSQLVHPDDARRVRSQYFSSDSGLLTFALALRGALTLDPEVNRKDFELARDLDARITVHSGTRITGRRTRDIDILRQHGLLWPQTTYVHCNVTPDEDLKAIKDSGGSVSVSPYVELIMGHGEPATGRMLDAGLRPTLSVDVTTTVPGDMFTQMRAALGYERIQALPDDIESEFAPTLTAQDVLRFATIDGAAACGLDDRTGSLTPGKRGDIIIVRTDHINMIPVDDPIAALVTCADVSNIDTVLVDGRVVKRDGKLIGADLARIGSLARAARGRVMAMTKEHNHV
jgi:cytosine/adenosine deaminase-related metal-dependent hydrolase